MSHAIGEASCRRGDVGAALSILPRLTSRRKIVRLEGVRGALIAASWLSSSSEASTRCTTLTCASRQIAPECD
jgi:hypothetical protein